MISALHKKKLGVVMDVVFNHTLGSGPENPKSVSVNHGPGRMAIYSLLIFTWLVNSEKPKVF
jgi:hypothetical protein